MDQRQRRVWLIGQLLGEYPEYRDTDEADLPIPHDDEEQRLLLRALQNVRPPAPVSERFLHVQDEYLGAELARRAVTDADDVPPIETIVPAGISAQRAWPASSVRNGRPSPAPQAPQTSQSPQSHATLAIWQGDITTLRCDAIVNAANSGLTGCYAPNHHCIDNAIHSAAGVQLRLACDRIMEQQGHPENSAAAPMYRHSTRLMLIRRRPSRSNWRTATVPACAWPPIMVSKPSRFARFPPANSVSPQNWRRASPCARSAIFLRSNFRNNLRGKKPRNHRKRQPSASQPPLPTRPTLIIPPTSSGK